MMTIFLPRHVFSLVYVPVLVIDTREKLHSPVGPDVTSANYTISMYKILSWK